MFRSLSDLFGYGINAVDGPAGSVYDFYFDDTLWGVRYVVADTGVILPGRKVLLAPQAITEADWAARLLSVPLTQKEIREGPSREEDKPVSRQEEEELHEYYQWAPYWAPGVPFGAAPIPPPGPQPEGFEKAPKGDPHLRSLREVLGYALVATDGQIGHIEDFVADDETWGIRLAVIDTRNWLPGKKVAFSPHWIDRIDWGGKMAKTRLNTDQIRNAPEFDPAEPVNEELEVRLYDYYGRPH